MSGKMRNIILWIPAFLFILLAVFSFFQNKAVLHGSGQIAPGEPKQVDLGEGEEFVFGEYTIVKKASFEIDARVLSKERYFLGKEAKLSPIDLALGWGPMSDEAVLENIKIQQLYRWYNWKTKEFPIPQNEIETHSANMHMVPATPAVKKQLLKVREGELVKIKGYLVFVRDESSWSWNSSLTREDTGKGSCEIVWVEEVVVSNGKSLLYKIPGAEMLVF